METLGGGGVGDTPGLAGSVKAALLFASRKTTSIMTIAKWPRPVAYDGMDITFALMAS